MKQAEAEEPRLKKKTPPYPDLPSLKDLYSQLPAASGKLKRFGSDTFRRGTGNADDLPMDLPVGPDYVLGPGDGLVLNLWGSTSQRLSRRIDRQGQIAAARGRGDHDCRAHHRAGSAVCPTGIEPPI